MPLQKIKFKAINEIENKIQSNSILMNLPASLELHKHYNQLFNDAMIKYKYNEKAKILGKKLSPEKENLELRGLVVRMVYIAYGYHFSIARNVSDFESYSKFFQLGYGPKEDDRFGICVRALSAILNLEYEDEDEDEDEDINKLIDRVEEYANSSNKIKYSSGEPITYQIFHRLVTKKNISKCSLVDQMSHKDESGLMAKKIFHFYLERLSDIISHHNISIQADNFIKNLGEIIVKFHQDQLENFTRPFNFYNKQTLEQYLMNNRSTRDFIQKLREDMDAAYLIEPQIEILKSVFDN